MPFDEKKWNTVARQSDVGGVALYAAAAVFYMQRAIIALKNGENIDEDMAKADEAKEQLDKAFRELTGWVPPDGE